MVSDQIKKKKKNKGKYEEKKKEKKSARVDRCSVNTWQGCDDCYYRHSACAHMCVLRYCCSYERKS